MIGELHAEPSRPLTVAGRRVGPLEPCLVVAEGGVNHNGSPELAHRLIDVAADAGADAVKFQTFDPALVVAEDASAAPYQQEATGWASQRRLLDELTLPTSAWQELSHHARDRDLVFLSTAFDIVSLDLVDQLGVPAFKIPSGELDNLAFIREVAGRGRPVILSTGMSTLDEVARAVDAATDAPGVCLLHCVSAYPAPVEYANLRSIPTMARQFALPVGWSDHTIGVVTALGARAMGAAILEKHVTVDKGLPGPDHAASAEPDEFEMYVTMVRALESALGDGVKRPVSVEEANREHVRRSLHAARDLSPGEVLSATDVVLLRPAVGLPGSFSVEGLTVRRAITSGAPIGPDDVG